MHDGSHRTLPCSSVHEEPRAPSPQQWPPRVPHVTLAVASPCVPAVLVVRDARPADYEHSTCLLLTLRRVSDTESNIKLGLFNASQAGIFPFDFPTIWVELLQGAECGLLGKPTRAASASTPTEEGLRLPAPLPPGIDERDRARRRAATSSTTCDPCARCPVAVRRGACRLPGRAGLVTGGLRRVSVCAAHQSRDTYVLILMIRRRDGNPSRGSDTLGTAVVSNPRPPCA